MARQKRYMITANGMPIKTRLTKAAAVTLLREVRYCIRGLRIERMPEVWG